jgi:zinc D-Ala-D-Ala carboxypeptidase
MRVGKYFTLEEFTISQTAVRNKIPNNPSPGVIEQIKYLCQNILDPLREHLGTPVVISSGFRSARLNRHPDVGGSSSTSQHVKGQAADIICPPHSVEDVIEDIRELGLPFDQLIHEGRWVHVSYSGRHRREVLKARFRPGQDTVYTVLN